MEKIKPLKRFGQNYLTDQNILRKITDEINPLPEDNLVEIGPGQGALTSKLSERINLFTVIEIDNRVINTLLNNFPQIKIINKDFLDVDLNELFLIKNKKLRIAGNLPYNITSPVLFKLIENNRLIKDAVLMVQYEVAKRMKGEKGTKDYGILSVLLKFFTDVKICFKVSPSSFYPKPRVHSAVVHLYFKETHLDEETKRNLVQVIKASFGNRRKTLKNSLSNSIFREINFKDSEIDLTKRAEQLDPEDFLKLTSFIKMQIIKNSS
jgi:16S rRNA (adenine1518-N6/adenine1519-N6)-dimethyltransferase